MRIPSLPKIQIRFLQKFITRVKSVDYLSFYKPAFTVGYLIACLFVLIPQIDHQKWYPGLIGSTDYSRSVEFSTHNKISILFNDEGNKEYDTATIIDRLDEYQIRDRNIEISNDRLDIELPSYFSDRQTQILLTTGSVSLKERTSDSMNFEGLYDPSGYVDIDQDFEGVSDATVIGNEEGYTTIELSFNDEGKKEEINELAQNVEARSLGLFVDSQLYLAQIVASTDGQPNPRLVVFSTEQEIRMIASNIRREPISSIQSYSLKKKDSKLNIDLSTILVISVMIPTLIGLMYRFYIIKSPIETSGYLMLIIIGVITITKALPVSWTILSIITLAILILLILIIEVAKLPTLLIVTAIMGITLEQLCRYSFGYTPRILYVASIYSLTFYLIEFFMGAYEKEN